MAQQGEREARFGGRYDTVGWVPDQAGQVESALGLWRQMKEQGGVPTVGNCNALLIACVDCGQGERALEIFESMQQMGACLALPCAHCM